jgi:hypothetical protein
MGQNSYSCDFNKGILMHRLRQLARPLLHLLLISFTTVSIYAPASQAAIIGTDQAISQTQLHNTRSQLQQLLDQDKVIHQLATLGVDSHDLQSRVEHMSDQELAIMADKMDELPAGQGLESLLVLVFLVLLLTDILGYTDVFPFVNKHH